MLLTEIMRLFQLDNRRLWWYNVVQSDNMEFVMKDYTRGLRDGMLETAKADLEQVATRIAILEEDLHKERDRKWDLIRKIKLLEQDKTLHVFWTKRGNDPW